MRPPLQTRTQPSRWTTWAATLANRHDRIALRSRGTEQVLSRAPRTVFSLNYRSPSLHLRTGPAINLALNIQLPASLHGGQTLVFAKPVAPLGHTVTAGTLNSAEGAQTSAGGAEYVTRRSSIAPVVVTSELLPPVRRVFSRLYDEERIAARTRSSLVAAQSVIELPDLLRQQHIRSDERVYRHVVLEHRESTRVNSPGDIFRHAGAEWASSRQTSTPRGTFPQYVDVAAAAAPVSPPVTVASITEHVVREIDRRLIAHRERTGRT